MMNSISQQKKANCNPNLIELKKQRDLTLGKVPVNLRQVGSDVNKVSYSMIKFCFHNTCNIGQT